MGWEIGVSLAFVLVALWMLGSGMLAFIKWLREPVKLHSLNTCDCEVKHGVGQ